MQTAIGIDPGLSNTALCFYSSNQVTMPHTECRNAGKAVPGLARFGRFGRLVDAVEGLCIEAAPDIVMLEGFSYASQGSVIVLAEFGSLLRLRLLSLSCQLVEVAPKELKKWATGKGFASKIQIVAALTKRYGVVYDTDDEYDAFALAKIGAQYRGWEEPKTANQAEVVRKLRERTEELGAAQGTDK